MLRICYSPGTVCCDFDMVCQVRCKIPGSEFAAYAGLPATCQIDGPPFFREWWAFFVGRRDRGSCDRCRLSRWRIVAGESFGRDGTTRCDGAAARGGRRGSVLRGRLISKTPSCPLWLQTPSEVARLQSADQIRMKHRNRLQSRHKRWVRPCRGGFCSVSRHQGHSSSRLGEDSDARNCGITRWSDPRLKFCRILDKVPSGNDILQSSWLLVQVEDWFCRFFKDGTHASGTTSGWKRNRRC